MVAKGSQLLNDKEYPPLETVSRIANLIGGALNAPEQQDT
jgi:hypothetical protein